MTLRSRIAARFAAPAAKRVAATHRELATRTEELARSEERLQLAQQVARIGTWDVDLERGEATWSDSLREISGVGDGEASFEAFMELVHPDDRPSMSQATARAMELGTEYEVEFRMCKPDGETRWFLARGKAIHDELGNPRRLVGVGMDIDDRKVAESERTALEDQLRHAQKMEAVGRLAGGIAHDFNNVLLGIRGYGELALRALARGDDAHEEIEEVLAGADRAATLTRQLLAFGRRQLLQPEIVDLNDAVAEIDKLLRRVIGEDVALDIVASPDSVTVNADRGQLEQVLANLAVNARDAMPAGGRLTLAVSSAMLDAEVVSDTAPGRYALLTVSDTGAGMDAETSARIFEPFFTTKSDGSGLGLATVHGIVQQTGGSISVDSEVGRGTTFKVYLPFAEGEPPVAAAQPANAQPGSTETILLVEDDGQVRAIVRQMLESYGYQVLVGEDGDDALALAEQGHTQIDLLLTDLVMPGLSGRQIAERFRTTHPCAGVLYMSGYTDDAVVRDGIVGRQAAFLQKPFNPDELARKVRTVLDAHGLAAEGS